MSRVWCRYARAYFYLSGLCARRFGALRAARRSVKGGDVCEHPAIVVSSPCTD